jgi:hypothetical protein
MSEFVSIVYWCPECQPERDPSVEILELRRCEAHYLDVIQNAVGPSTCEAGGEDNRRFCDFIHRRVVSVSPAAPGE